MCMGQEEFASCMEPLCETAWLLNYPRSGSRGHDGYRQTGMVDVILPTHLSASALSSSRGGARTGAGTPSGEGRLLA